MDIQLVTLDLDDTLWSIKPLIRRAEAQLHAWLQEKCPLAAVAFTPDCLAGLRREAERLFPERRGDITALRRASILLALQRAGEDESLADEAFEVFWSARNEVEFFDDVLPALERLKSRFMLAAVTNGNACLKRTGLENYFDFYLSAREVGCPKPEREIFRTACREAGVLPENALHAGDDIQSDVRGALGAGMNAAWINRDPNVLRVVAPPALTVPNLATLADRLAA